MLQSSRFGTGEGGLRSSLSKISGQPVVDANSRNCTSKNLTCHSGSIKHEKCKKMFTIKLKFSSLLRAYSSRIFAILKCSPRYCFFTLLTTFMKKICLARMKLRPFLDGYPCAHVPCNTRAVVFDFQFFV